MRWRLIPNEFTYLFDLYHIFISFILSLIFVYLFVCLLIYKHEKPLNKDPVKSKTSRSSNIGSYLSLLSVCDIKLHLCIKNVSNTYTFTLFQETETTALDTTLVNENYMLFTKSILTICSKVTARIRNDKTISIRNLVYRKSCPFLLLNHLHFPVYT